MRLVSDKTTIQEFWDDLRSVLNRDESYYNLFNWSVDLDNTTLANYYSQYRAQRKEVDDILRADREQLLRSVDAHLTIDQINSALALMMDKVSHIRYGSLSPIPLKPIPPCSSCDKSFDVLVEFDTDCFDCGTVLLCEECIKESVALLYQHLSESIGD